MYFTPKQVAEARRSLGVPDYVPEPDSYEQKFGIGAQDSDTVNSTCVQVTLGDDLPFYENGELYAIARREANRMRSRAFTWDDLERPYDLWGHPTDRAVLSVEEGRGIPAW